MDIFPKILLACSPLLLACPGAMAQQAGDTIVGAGLAVLSPRESLGPLSSTGPGAAALNAATAGATADIDTVATLSLSVLHMFTDNLAAELTLGVPPKLKVDVHLRSGSHIDAASAREITPALVGKYLFMRPGDRWRPYLGLGVAYTKFDQVRINRSDPLVVGLAGTSASLSSEWSPVVAAGFIYNIDDRWSVNASVSHLRLKTTATLVGAGGTTTGELKLNPVDYVVRLGYRF
ncbi:outer membrane beta-barrel protein [Ramlibacter tataouinensis]|uniref:OmpW/AlkL family protein n=1 Tax=Ramlibacter tataouinensis TaxID=94132 RepID=UPI0022F3F805|nr:OmpW family outer membrane protein [Ramlibacter tataouinensis]WBY03135.1 outer membrane beta-barrel protein [Ramlibacter tataouinensis]